MSAAGISSSPRTAGRMPQLDGLRAFAVAAVLVHHLLAEDLVPALTSIWTGACSACACSSC